MYKIWNNGNNVTVINICPDCWSFENVIGESNLGILGCYLKRYDINWGNGSNTDVDDTFSWALKEKKVESFDFTAKDLLDWYGTDEYYDDEGNTIDVSPEKYNTVDELLDLIFIMKDNDCLIEGDTYFDILSKTKFKDLIIKPFFAYIHSGISISFSDFKDPWDSGLAGIAWYELNDGESMEDAEVFFREDFEAYNDYLCGLYEEYNIIEYKKNEDGSWERTDDYWTTEKSIEDVYEAVGHKFENEVEHFNEEDYEYARKNMVVGDMEMLEFLNDMN